MNLIKNYFPNGGLLFFLLFIYYSNTYSQTPFNLTSFKGLVITGSPGSKIGVQDDAIKLLIVANGRPRLELINPTGYWDISGFQFLNIEIENKEGMPQMVEVGINDNFWTMGATIIPGKSTKVLKALLLKDETDHLMRKLYTGMHGYPSGFTKLWFKTSLDSVKKLALFFPNSVKGFSCIVKKIWVDGKYKEIDKKLLTSFVDEFGQYKYQSWPEKISSVKDIAHFGDQERKKLSGHKFSGQWDKYGGWEKGPQFTATGKFYVKKYIDKWWLIDPEGRLFWSNGIDCINSNGETLIKGRESYFSGIPRYDNASRQFYSTDGNGFDFRAYNLYRKYGKSWKSDFAKRIHLRLRNWGINTIGNWSDPAIFSMNKTPYVVSVSSRQTGKIVDPFVTNFREDLEAKIVNVIHAGKQNDWCIGVFIDNELRWKDMAENIIHSDVTQPAKQELKHFLLLKYCTIEHLNQNWHTLYRSWDEFVEDTSMVSNSLIHADIREFLQKFSDQYFKECRDAVKNAAPGYLYLGCRFDFHSYPEDTSLNWVIKAASLYCDVVSFNRYTYTCAELKPPVGLDFPILIGEFHFGSLHNGLFHPGLKYAANQKERARLYYSFQTQAINNSFIVGSHWFQLNDQPLTGRRDGENYQIGFLTVADVTYELLAEKAKLIGKTMYQARLRK